MLLRFNINATNILNDFQLNAINFLFIQIYIQIFNIDGKFCDLLMNLMKWKLVYLELICYRNLQSHY
jgi:hypothetical protein